MALIIFKRGGERAQSLARRFAKSIQRSGVLYVARQKRFKQRGKSVNMRKRSALRREEMRKKFEETRKMGKS